MGLALDIIVVFSGFILVQIWKFITKYIRESIILNEVMIEYYRTKSMKYRKIKAKNKDKETSTKIIMKEDKSISHFIKRLLDSFLNGNNEIISDSKSREEINQNSNEDIIEKREDETVSDLIKIQKAEYLEGFNFKAVKQYFCLKRSMFNAQIGMTPLHFAVEKNYFPTVEFLIKFGYRIDQPDFNKNTPLHRACFYGYLIIVNLLLEKGANKNSQNRDNQTPLHIAIISSQLEVVKLLIKNGADQSIPNKYGTLPIGLAKQLNKMDIVRLLAISYNKRVKNV